MFKKNSIYNSDYIYKQSAHHGKKQSILDANHYNLEFYMLHIGPNTHRCQKQTTHDADIHSQYAVLSLKNHNPKLYLHT